MDLLYTPIVPRAAGLVKERKKKCSQQIHH